MIYQYLQEQKQLARAIEEDRLQRIEFDSFNLKQRLAITQGRCEICTLKPPCRHIKSVPEPDEDLGLHAEI